METNKNKIGQISIEKIHPNAQQPRQMFDEVELNQLADSIAQHGIIQPISVVETSDNYFEIISGERRYRACIQIGLKEMPCYVLNNTSSENKLELALLENLQRADLNPIEIASSYQRLVLEVGITHEELAKRMSKDRSSITNILRLLALPKIVQKGLEDKKISLGHGKILCGIGNEEEVLRIYDIVVDKKLSVKQTQNLLDYSGQYALLKRKKEEIKSDEEIQTIKTALSNRFNPKIDIWHNFKKQSGKVTISYNTSLELYEMLNKMGIEALKSKEVD